MEEKIIGVSGAIGSFSEQAAKEYCRNKKIEDYKLEYLISVENVLSALKKEKINLGIFPIENSNGGIVIESVYAMSRYIFNIQELFEIPVIHCLLVKPGIKKEDIKTIASHDQAIKQCKMYIKRSWPSAAIEQRDDTAKAAKDLSEGVLTDDTAVLAPESCAKLYNLEILEKGVQDLKFNFTSFLVVTK
ncbi:MAG: prephenate dehydratase domain-containing protein [Candidatus Pacebacteria bacterium]|nr:prephenate dehydratase domain-containing protein [Candidatus Paceibacterota bacterium]